MSRTLKSLIGSAGIGTLTRMKKSELVSAAATIRKALRSRAQTFARHDAMQGIPERFRTDLPTAKDFENRNSLLSWVNDALHYLREPESTYKGWEKGVNARLDAYNQTLQETGRKTFKNMDDFNRFGRFMGEMQERFGENWHGVSDQVYEMQEQAERLGLDPSQLTRNFDYWAEHLEDLQQAEPINYRRSGKPVYASDYARQLHLPKLKEYYEQHPELASRKRRKRMGK